ncbi:helix-turn-helix transcriptional regulator [Oceanirhabdus seepicola]|uniref:Helix-turn-helix transcriptional regulator n=2 Tax=Oceanirhabdus seepicola TaxID=2828781 RepID=A0A9J6NYB8_9CLOT|nr:helix-turn-helix transcriptional regulator [Oceanirhabdus seepicola]
MRDIKQRNMAEILEMTRESYARKENGHSQFTLNEVKVIKDLFGMSVEEIFFD